MTEERALAPVKACNLRHSWFLPLIISVLGLLLALFFGIQLLLEYAWLILIFIGLLFGIATLKARYLMPIILIAASVFLFDYSPFLNLLLIIDTLKNLLGCYGVLFFWGFLGVSIGHIIRDFYDKWLCRRGF